MNKKIVWLPYDFDTAIGINNEGSLTFGYELEDTDHLAGGADVFNGQDSVVWNNIRDAFGEELAAMYRQLRSEGKLSYAVVEEMFEDHQDKWPEAIFNEDSWFKYIDPLTQEGKGDYLPMLQGSKEEQRKWWLFNRFRYIDSKYNAGDALSDLIQIRGYAKSDITVIPYADIYPSVKYGSYLVQKRGHRGESTTLICPLDNVNDTEIYIYSASQLASVGDLSGFKVGFADFSMATKLQSLKLGDASGTYNNPNLKTLTLGNNTLLKTVDVRNCSGLGTGDAKTVNLSGCVNIENVFFDGTAITGVDLPNGGILKVLHLPATVTNLSLMNQTALTDLTIPDYSNISTLRIENGSAAIDSKAILMDIPASARVRLIGIAWTVASKAELESLLDTLDTMRGLDEHGNNVDTAQVSGTIHVTGTITGDDIAAWKARYPYINYTADSIAMALSYYNYDGTSLITTEQVVDGGDGVYSGQPSRDSTAQYTYAFAGWATEPNGSADANATKAVTANRSVYAAYTATLRTYTVTWMNRSTTMETDTNVPYGTTPTYDGETPVDTQDGYPFEGWTPAVGPITGNTTYTAKFANPLEVMEIEDSWDNILAACADGSYATKYKLGNYKPLDLGTEGIVNMQIIGMDVDNLADGSGTVPLTWLSMELLNTSHRMNPSRKTDPEDSSKYVEGTGAVGGWEKSEMRTYLKETVKPLIPATVRNAIKTVYKSHPNINTSGSTETQTVQDDVWLPSYVEMFGSTSQTNQPRYKVVFPDANSRMKSKVGETSAFWWWTRSALISSDFNVVIRNGDSSSVGAASSGGVALGFCT